MRLFIAEKPELARAIVEALSGGKKEDGAYRCGTDTVTWCFGHMLQLLEPGEYAARYEHWRLDDLPFSFVPWRKKPIRKTEVQLNRILKLLQEADSVVHAGDPDAEGQLLVDEILTFAKFDKPVQRLLINDNTPAAVKKALLNLRSNADFAGLSAAAEARQVGDQLFGFNLTRLYTLTAKHQGYAGGTLSVGRVQTPILGLVVRRDRENATHRKEYFYTVTGQFRIGELSFPAAYAPCSGDTVDEKNRLTDSTTAQAIADAVSTANAVILEATTETKTTPAPLPYNLLKLQADAARLYHLKPDYVKDITQTLREKHRLITYNRSDCQYIPDDQHSDAPAVLAAIARTCPALADVAGHADSSRKGRAFDSGKVTAHHAILPTGSTADFDHLSKEERLIYALIARAYIAQFYPPYEYEQTTVRVQVNHREFLCRTHVALAPGWKALFRNTDDARENDDRDEVPLSLKDLSAGQSGVCDSAAVTKGETKPKPLYTMANLLEDLTRVAQYVRDARLKKLLIDKDRDKAGEHGGIGTPATRDAIIATLFERGFLIEQRHGKTLHVVATEAGCDFYDTLPDSAKFPDMTALWHEQQLEIERGERGIGQFVDELVTYISGEVERVKREGLGLKTAFHACPACAKALLRRSSAKGAFWGCSGYPDCKTTLSDKDGQPDVVAQDSKPPTSELHLCLDCGKGLVRRKSRNGRDYWWGCSGYPSCKACYSDRDGKPDYTPMPQGDKAHETSGGHKSA